MIRLRTGNRIDRPRVSAADVLGVLVWLLLPGLLMALLLFRIAGAATS